MLRLLIARHGQTEWNFQRRNQGVADTPLDEAGRRQTRQLAESFAGERPAIIYSSDLSRTMETAHAIAENGRVTVRPDQRLRERNYGQWEGKTPEEIEQEHPEELAAYRKDPVLNGPTGGETGIEVFARVGYFAAELLQSHQAETVVVIAHGGSIAALLAALLHGSPATAACLRLFNCAVSEIVIRPDGRRRLARFNDTAHLDPLPLDWTAVGQGQG